MYRADSQIFKEENECVIQSRGDSRNIPIQWRKSCQIVFDPIGMPTSVFHPYLIIDFVYIVT